MSDGTKWCPRCETDLPIDQFTKGQGWCKPCRKEYNKAYSQSRSQDPAYLARRRMHNMAWRTGLKFTHAELLAFAEKCTGLCDICEVPIAGKAMHLDHDAETGALRGWLCSNCNLGLGHFKDSEVFLTRALTYLKNSRYTEKSPQ